MQKTIKEIQFGILAMSFLFVLQAFSGQDNSIFWFCDFSNFDAEKWVWSRSQAESMKDAARVRVVPEASGNYATFHSTVPAVPENSFLQVYMGEIENSAAKPWVSNASSGGFGFGHLFSGWNTFSMQQNAGRPFALSLGLLGGGKNAGPWIDYRMARIVSKPINGLLITCLGKTAEAPLQVGDELLFEYYAENAPAEKHLQVSCFIHPQMIEFPLHAGKGIIISDNGQDGDQTAADLIYSGRITISKEAFECQNDSKARLMGAVNVHGEYSYFTVPNQLQIVTGNSIPKSLTTAGNLQTRQDRQLWFDRAKGTNLALGKSLQLAPKPDYRLTSDENDSNDLTDGQLSNRTDDKIWFDKKAVGWYFGNGVAFLKLELDAVENIDRVLVRCLGGTVGNFQFPKTFEVFVSQDGKLFHLARRMQKLMPGEKSQSDFENFYYLEEQGSTYSTRMYPFELSVQAEARFVLLKLIGTSGSIFTDEMAVFKAEKTSPEFNLAYTNPGQEIPLEGLLVRPRLEKLDLIRKIPAPQRFEIMDLRKTVDESESLALVFDLPPGISVLSPETPKTEIQIKGNTYLRYEFPLTLRQKKISSPTLYLSVDDDCDGSLPAYCMARCGDQDQFRSTLPVTLVRLPEIPRFKRLHISLAWMDSGQAMQWPDFLQQWDKLGFNVVSVFPRWWNHNSCEKQRQFVADAKAAGYQIIMNDSAFHEMMRGHKEGSEIFCDIPGLSHRMLCPSYRGDFYKKEMERVERCVRLGTPDYVFYDIECWGQAQRSAAQCRRCQEALRQSGKTMDEFLLQCHTEQMRDLDAAVRKAAAEIAIPVPRQGDYNRHALSGMKYFQMIYPQYINMAMPSLYVAGRAIDVHHRIRNNYQMLQSRQIIPWLSTGTYGEFPPPKVESMVLEALLNGANGITYYCFGDFTDSPLDFYYHARALSMLRPYEDLIMDGNVLEPQGDNQEMFYSGIEADGKMLLLTGNYHNANQQTSFKFPWPIKQIIDLQTNEKLPDNENCRFTVPKGGFRLFYAEKK